jgi:hypothetical protein
MAYNRTTKPPQKKTPEQKQAEAADAMSHYQAEKARVDKNMMRLRAERLARQADEAPSSTLKTKGRKA